MGTRKQSLIIICYLHLVTTYFLEFLLSLIHSQIGEQINQLVFCGFHSNHDVKAQPVAMQILELIKTKRSYSFSSLSRKPFNIVHVIDPIVLSADILPIQKLVRNSVIQTIGCVILRNLVTKIAHGKIKNQTPSPRRCRKTFKVLRRLGEDFPRS